MSKYTNSANVEHEMLCHTANDWGHVSCRFAKSIPRTDVISLVVVFTYPSMHILSITSSQFKTSYKKLT
jgi:hypothetical protein